MYKTEEVLAKIDGLSQGNVCHYSQGSGMCTGVAMEWVRRLLVGDKVGNPNPCLLPKVPEGGMDPDLFIQKWDKKDVKRAHAQKLIYGKSQSAFDSNYQSNPEGHKCLSKWYELTQEWEKAKNITDKYNVRTKIIDWAKKYDIAKVPPGIDIIGKYLAEEANRDAYNHDYLEWRKNEPIEVAVFKEYSEEVMRMYFDDELTALRARFKGMKIVESANSLKIHTKTSWEAVQQALRNQQFTDDRGMVFGILGKNIAHSLGLYYAGDEFLWMDPNYGVWYMNEHGIVETMKYLFDETGKQGEAGVYQENGGGTPDGFEYSVWAISAT